VCLRSNKEKRKESIWMNIASCFENRSASSIHKHAIKVLTPCKRGPWDLEEIEKLLEMVERVGKKWTHISETLGRPPLECRDKYRDFGDFNDGEYSLAEQNQLLELVRHTCKLPENATLEEIVLYDKIPWQKIGDQMDNRSRGSCLKKVIKLRKNLAKEKIKAQRQGFWQISRAEQLDRDIIFLESIQDSGAESESEMVWTEHCRQRPELAGMEQRWKVLGRSAPVDDPEGGFQGRVAFVLEERRQEARYLQWPSWQRKQRLPIPDDAAEKTVDDDSSSNRDDKKGETRR